MRKSSRRIDQASRRSYGFFTGYLEEDEATRKLEAM